MEEVEFRLRYCLAAEFYLEVVGIRLNGDEFSGSITVRIDKLLELET